MKLIFIVRSIMYKLVELWDNLMDGVRPNLVLLCIHSFKVGSSRYSISVDLFESIIKKVTNDYSFCDKKVLEAYLNGSTLKKKRYLMLTIDDGYKSVLDLLPVTKKYQIPVILFVIADRVHVDHGELDSQEELLTWSEIRHLHDEGWEIGCHSSTHRYFGSMNNESIMSEIQTAKLIIEEKINAKVESFAYPRGYYSKDIIKTVKNSGYKYAFTLDSDSINSITNRLRIPRVTIDSTHRVADIPGLFSPTWMKIRRITNKYKIWERYLA